MKINGSDAIAFARQYCDRDWRPIPVPFRQKGPIIDEWQNLRLEAEDLPRYFRGKSNVGVLTGEPSGGLVDVDLDHPLAVELAPQFLPPTPCMFGRAGKPRSHYLYVCPGAVTHKRTTGKAAGMIVELRATGLQTVFPGSVHECGEAIEWVEEGEPAFVAYEALRAAVDALADEVERRLGLRSGNDLAEDAELPDTTGWTTRDEQNDGLKPGADFNARGDARAVLRRNGWTLVRQESGGVERWRRPGKTHGISGSLKDGKAFFCFTSSTAIPDSLENKRGYSPFAVLTYLEHSGDFSAAATALSANGFGSPPKSKTVPASPARKLTLPEPFRPFPVDVLPRVCSDFVRQAARSIDCDESMIALPLLGSAAAAIGNSCRIELKRDYSEPSVIWAGIVCESGTRKSSALESPLKPVRKREGHEIQKFKDALADYNAAMQNHKVAAQAWQKKGHKQGEPAPEEPEKPICRRFTVSDITTEALAVRLEQNPRGLLLVRDELAGFFTGLNQYKGGKGADEAAFLAMHGARTLVVDRKNLDKPSIYVPLANLSVVGAIQPGILRRVLTRDRMESGMAARFLFAYPPSRAVKWTEKSVDGVVEDRLATMFDFLLSLQMKPDEESNELTPRLLPLTVDAKRLWVEFHDDHASEQAELHGDLTAAWAKLTGYAARLSLVCQLAEWASGNDWQPPTEVGVEAVQAGIALARWFSEETKRIYSVLDETDEQREVRELAEYLRQRGGTISARDLARGPRRYRHDVDRADAELQRLVTGGLGIWVDQPSTEQGGRPTRVFCLKNLLAGDETPAIPEEDQGFVATPDISSAANVEEEGEWEG